MKWIISVLCLLAVFCSSANAKDLLDTTAFPEWFQDALAREKKVSKKSTLEIPELNVKSRIRGKITSVEQGEGFWYYILDIGTDSPMECYAFTEYDGPANSLHVLLESSLSNVEQLNQLPLASTFIFSTGVEVVDGRAHTQLDLLYNLGEGSEQLSGVLKGISTLVGETLQICMHNEIGYRKAFKTVSHVFFDAFVQEETNPPFYESISTVSFNDITVGYAHETHRLDQDGDVETYIKGSMLIPVDASSVSRTDTYHTSWSLVDGGLINGQSLSIENSTLAHRLNIAYNDEFWEVAGEIQGKQVDIQTDHQDYIISEFGSYAETAKLLESDQTMVELPFWSADADPSSITQIKLAEISDRSDVNLKLEVGPINMEMQVDKDGVPQSAAISAGPVNMFLDTVYSRGSPKL